MDAQGLSAWLSTTLAGYEMSSKLGSDIWQTLKAQREAVLSTAATSCGQASSAGGNTSPRKNGGDSPVTAAQIQKIRAIHRESIGALRELKHAKARRQTSLLAKLEACREMGISHRIFSRIAVGKSGRRPKPE
jgi:hypothetical protein